AKYRDADLQAAVRERLQQGLRPLAQQAAYIALGAQRHNAPFALLSAAADLPTPDGRAQSGAFTGLAETRKPEAAPILQDKAAYGGSPHQSRPAAVSALATLSKGMEHAQREAIAEQLRDLLRDPWPPVVWAAARGLVTMADTEALDALEAFRRPLSTQEQAGVDRLMAALDRKRVV